MNIEKNDYEEYKKQIKYGSYEYYLYHNPKNERLLLWCIIITPIAFLFCTGTLFQSFMQVLLIWIIYLAICFINNICLDYDNDVIYARKVCFNKYLDKKYKILE